jgi:hypothetical protein
LGGGIIIPHRKKELDTKCYTRMIKSSRIRWEGHVARMRDMRNVYILFEKPEGKRALG